MALSTCSPSTRSSLALASAFPLASAALSASSFSAYRQGRIGFTEVKLRCAVARSVLV